MADRFPLVANSSTSQIQEIPSGDTLDLSGNNVKGVGIITATTFSGNVTGNVTGTATTATTLSGTPNISVGTLGCGNVTSTGDVTGVNATFSGNLTVQGTTTTIDTAVTSVDSLQIDGSVGIGTTSAESALHVVGSIPNAPTKFGVHVGAHSGYGVMQFTSDTGGIIDFGESGVDSAGRIIYTHSDDTLKVQTNNAEKVRIGSSGEIGLSGANYGTAGQVLTSQGSGSAPQWAAPAASGGTSAGTRYTNPNTTNVEWTSLPANIQTIDVGYGDSYASSNNAENERIVLRLGTSAGYVTSNYNNRSWNMYASSIGHGFNATKSAFIPYYWIDNTDRATAMFTLRRMGTSNTFQAQWHEYIGGGHAYIATGGGYVDLGAELTQVRFQTINGNATLNGSFWMNYTTR